MITQWHRAGRPILAGVLLALVELAVVLRGGGRTLMSGLGEAVQYLAASFAIAICIAFALWAIGSWVALLLASPFTDHDRSLAAFAAGIVVSFLVLATGTVARSGSSETATTSRSGATPLPITAPPHTAAP